MAEFEINIYPGPDTPTQLPVLPDEEPEVEELEEPLTEADSGGSAAI